MRVNVISPQGFVVRARRFECGEIFSGSKWLPLLASKCVRPKGRGECGFYARYAESAVAPLFDCVRRVCG